jgi:hypothetical protein
MTNISNCPASQLGRGAGRALAILRSPHPPLNARPTILGETERIVFGILEEKTTTSVVNDILRGPSTPTGRRRAIQPLDVRI